MERTEITNVLTAIFRKILAKDTLILSDNLTANDVENWDSLTHMLLISEIETEFSIKFKLKDLNKMRNVGDMIETIISKL
ncbi:MAG: acyl carrier protein [Bacteroidales bacterium]|nr:acyl carrier protein [Bacteroidales bacterium]